MLMLQEVQEMQKFYPSISVWEIPEFIRDSIENGVSVFLWGAGGVGKTTSVYDFFRKNNYEFEDIKLSQLNPITAVGLSYPDTDKKMTLRFLRERLKRLHDVLKEGGKAGIFFDEFLHANPDTIASVWELILEKQLDGWKFDGLVVIAASNPNLKKMSLFNPALWSRFRHAVVVPKKEEVAQYIYSRTGCTHVASLLMAREDMLIVEDDLGFAANPRLWEYVARACCQTKTPTTGYLHSSVYSVFQLLKNIKHLEEIEKYLENPREIETIEDDFEKSIILWNLVFILQNKIRNNLLEIDKVKKFCLYLESKYDINNAFVLSIFSTIKDHHRKTLGLERAVEIASEITGIKLEKLIEKITQNDGADTY